EYYCWLHYSGNWVF
nr:immunoglobulin light chain junction region [Macaca mulatta]MOW04624.1 immunoglobulin light chain junction region [Macaca mulatta]MOW06452.1 immunoglobulin light chain junction region [Macaca mulatta]